MYGLFFILCSACNHTGIGICLTVKLYCDFEFSSKWQVRIVG
jgi:hypothetical protein